MVTFLIIAGIWLAISLVTAPLIGALLSGGSGGNGDRREV